MWVHIHQLSTQLLVFAARDRRPALLRSRRVVTLVRWPSSFGQRKRYVRVLDEHGKPFTVRVTDVVAVDIHRQEITDA